MSQDVTAECQAQAQEQAPRVPLLVQYKTQLESFKQQKKGAEIQLQQLEGAIFACEYMIKQYEENAKQSVVDLAQKFMGIKNILQPNENQGEINDGKVDQQAKEQAS